MGNNNVIQYIYMLSPLQNGMLFHWLLEKDAQAFFEQLTFTIKGDFDVELFEKSFKHIVQRYDIFRTIFVYKDIAFPRQVVLKERDVKVNFIDISGLRENEKTEFIEQYKKQDIEASFDITKDILIRISIIRFDRQAYRFVISFHHIILDGWSFNIVINELFTVYKMLRENKPFKLEPVQPYRNYIEWLKKQDKNEASLFWKKYLKGFKEQTNIFKFNKTPEYVDGQKEYTLEIEEDLKEKLVALSKRYRVTLNTLFETAWGILLQRYNNVGDVVFGKVVSGRGIDTELAHTGDPYTKVVGLCINTIPVRIQCGEGIAFAQLARKVHKLAFSSEKYSYFPLMEIQSNSALKKNLFDHIIVFENYPIEKEVGNLLRGQSSFDFSINQIEAFETANFNLYISITVSDKILVKVIYKTLIYDEDLVAGVFQHFKKIFMEVINDPKIAISRIEILTEAEKKKILYEFNNFGIKYNGDKKVHELFEEQTAKSLEQIAIIHNNRVFTYREINARSNQLARKLKEKGVQPDDILGIMVEHSYNTIVGIMAILKAGGAYLPLASDYPVERIHYMLKDSASKIVITEEKFIEEINFKGEAICVDDQENYKNENTNLEVFSKQNNLMYVTYTSGSTGQPKGVMVEHGNVVSYIYAFNREFNINNSDSFLQLSSYCFDTFVEEVFPTLINGGKLVIPNKSETQNFDFLSKLIKQHQVSVISSTPQILNELSNYEPYLSSVRLFISGGDVLKPEYISKLIKNAKVYNTYGPTETTVCACYYNCPEGLKGNIPIGKPILNYGIYILDKNNKLAPVGVTGEIFIAGDGVTRGYLNLPELTTATFLPDPFRKNGKMYKTGDFGRWLPDGNIEFMGRNDHQVKIRGLRVELGEIESCLLSCEFVKDAVVLLQENKNKVKYLHAYIVSNQEIDITTLNHYLSFKLPNYMTPSKYTCVEKIPLTYNGKIDYNALMKPQQDTDIKIYNRAPINIIEVKLIKILSEALKQKIGINDNFFDFGGDSLTIIKMMPDLFKEGINLSIQDFYQYPTVKKLADKLLNARDDFEADDKKSCIESITRVSNLHKEKITIHGEKNTFANIFLTGVTGFLGIHLLDELLQTTQAKIFCLVRGKNETDAARRLLKLLQVYHGHKYDELISDRIIIINGDLTEDRFGLSEKKYVDLGKRVELVIHTAALVKYFGRYEEFEAINVSGTNRIIEFASKYKKKLGYASTISVSGNGFKQEKKGLMFTENDFYIGQNYIDNVYIKSKFEAENLMLKAIDTGLAAVIFRVGNLTGRYSDGQFQFNIDENMFYILIKTIIESKFFPDKLLECDIEFTPVDYCSKAIVELLKTPECSGKIFHIFNHKTVTVQEILKIVKPLGIDVDIMEEISNDNYLTKYNYNSLTDENYRVDISSKITCVYLKQLGFDWPEVNTEYVQKIIQHINKVNFLKDNLII